MVAAVAIRRAVGVLLLAGAASAFIASPMQHRPAPFCSKLRLGVSMSEASEEMAAAAPATAELLEAGAAAAAEGAEVEKAVNAVLLGISAGDKMSVMVADDFDLINAKKAWKKRRRTKSPLLIPVQSATVGDAVTLLRMSQEAAVGLHPGQKLQAWVADIRTDENRLILSSSPRYALRRKHGKSNRDRKGPTGESVHIAQIKSGMPLRGRIVKVLDSGAFVNCGVQRKGRGGVRRNVDGYLSRADLAGTALLPAQVRDGKLKDSVKLIKRGMELDVWIKEVRKQSGKFTVTLDSSWSKGNARELKEKKELAKQQARGLAVGATRKGTVTSVEPPQGKNGMVSITVNLASNVHGVVLTDSPGELKQGDVVRVAVTDIGTKRSGSQIRLALLAEGEEYDHERPNLLTGMAPVYSEDGAATANAAGGVGGAIGLDKLNAMLADVEEIAAEEDDLEEDEMEPADPNDWLSTMGEVGKVDHTEMDESMAALEARMMEGYDKSIYEDDDEDEDEDGMFDDDEDFEGFDDEEDAEDEEEEEEEEEDEPVNIEDL